MLEQLEPAALWRNFAALNAIPRPSRGEQQVLAFLRDFADRRRLEHSSDAAGNLLIRKSGKAGATVALQSHVDMVHQKDAESDFDFATQGIGTRVEGDWVRADGTTLGADNGIGVAAMLAVLDDASLQHPPLEALFTVSEEIGLLGARALQPGMLQATRLLNLDTEDDRELCIGCAGAIDLLARGGYDEQPGDGEVAFEIALGGLTGGHSGTDIHRGRGNANRLMLRVLSSLPDEFQLLRWDGGGLRNAIPREARAWLRGSALPQAQLEQLQAELSLELAFTDPEFRLTWRSLEGSPRLGLSPGYQRSLLAHLQGLLSGISRMHPEVPGLVQTSNNWARILLEQGQLQIHCLCRGSLDSERRALARSLAQLLEGIEGLQVALEGDYPGWAPRPQADIVRTMASIYRELFGQEPQIVACHAGLECGIIGQHYPDMEMISFGPNILGAHSPQERVQISSVQKFWKLLCTTLQRLVHA
jgi:dipeptidase D